VGGDHYIALRGNLFYEFKDYSALRVIYAGGVGYIEGANDEIALICEKECCDKISGVC